MESHSKEWKLNQSGKRVTQFSFFKSEISETESRVKQFTLKVSESTHYPGRKFMHFFSSC